MLLEAVIRRLEAEFSSLYFVVDAENHTVIIPPAHEGFGRIEIEDDLDELIIIVGNFTHWHAGRWGYGECVSDQEKADAIAEDIAEFLRDVLNDKIIMWGSHKEGGGFVYRDEPQSQQSPLKTYQKWLWSGLLSN
jgi:hypothetical protein